jgi:hypothetical protein
MGKSEDIGRIADLAVESDLIAQLATTKDKREQYEKRAERLHTLADKLQHPVKSPAR